MFISPVNFPPLLTLAEEALPPFILPIFSLLIFFKLFNTSSFRLCSPLVVFNRLGFPNVFEGHRIIQIIFLLNTHFSFTLPQSSVIALYLLFLNYPNPPKILSNTFCPSFYLLSFTVYCFSNFTIWLILIYTLLYPLTRSARNIYELRLFWFKFFIPPPWYFPMSFLEV